MNISPSAALESGNGPVAAVPSTLAGVLIIDDEEIVSNTLIALLKADGYDAAAASSAEQGVALLRNRPFEVAIVDLIMPGLDGIRTIAALKEVDPDIEVIILTGCATVESTVAALRQGACDFLRKPIGLAELRPALLRALDKRRLKAALPMYKASRPLMATLDRQEIVSAALSLAQHTLRATAAALALAPGEGAGLMVYLSNDHGAFTAAHARCLAEIALRAGEPLRSLVFEAMPSCKTATEMPPGSVLTLPLGTHNSLIGALVLWRSQGQAQFSQFDRQQGGLLADEIVVALDNSRLYRELAHKVEELQAARSGVARAEARARAVMQTAQEAIDRAEARAKAIIETAQEAIVLLDQEGVVWDLNPQAIGMLGRTREEAIGRNLAEIAISAGFRERFRMHLETAFLAGRHPAQGCLEVCAVRANGEEFPLEISSTVIETKQGKLLSTFARDITARKRAERATQESEAKLQAIFDGVKTGILVIDAETHRIVDANPLALDLVGASRERVLGAVCHRFICPAENGRCPVTDLGLVVDESERILLTASGEQRNIIKSVRPMVIAGRKLLLESFVDITARRQAEERLLLTQFSIDHASEAITWLDDQGRIVYVNEAACRSFGRPREELLCLTISEIDPDVPPEAWGKIWERVKAAGSVTFDARHINKLGRVFPVEVTSNYLQFGGKEYNFSFSRDITERKEAERQINLQVTALKAAANGIVITDQQGEILWANPAFTRLTGYELHEVVGRSHRVLKSGSQNQAFYQNLWRTIIAGEVWQGELVNRRKDGSQYTEEMTITPVQDDHGAITHFIAIKQDVTERRREKQALLERTVYLNSLFDISPVGIVVLDTNGRIQMANSTFERLFLYSRQEIIGAGLDDLIVPPELAAEAKTLTALCLGGAGAQATSQRRRKDGSLVDTEIYGVPLVIDAELRGYLGLYQDITTRKRAEADLIRYAEDLEISKAAQEEHAQKLARLVEELAQERDLLGTVMDNLPDCIFYKDRQSRFLRANPPLARMLGLNDPREAVGKTDFDFFPTEEARAYLSDEQRVIETGEALIGRIEKVRQPDGHYRWYSTSTVPIRDNHGRVLGLVGISRDMTESMEAEKKIRESEAKYRSLIANIPDVIWTADSELQFAFVSPNIERLSGFSLDEVYRAGARLFLQNVHPDDVGKVTDGMGALFARDEPYDVECRVRRKDGEWIWIHDRAVATYEKNGVRYADGLLSDITLSKRAEETLRASEERYRELFENASDIVYTTGMDTRLTSLNRVGQKILGYSAQEATQLDLEQLVAPRHRQLLHQSLAQLLAGDADLTLEVEITNKEARQMMLEVKPRLIYRGGKPVGVQGIARDITGRDEAEVELRHAQKLESVGRLAAGIAHEINTPIQFVGDNTRFLQDSFQGLQTLLAKYRELRAAADSSPVNRDLLAEVRRVEDESDCAYLLEEIPKALSQTLEGVTRVATIVRAMKEFAHPEGKEMAAADLNRALLSTLTVARNELKYVADVETAWGELPPVVCNIGDLNQVFLNLLVNAAHAIADIVKGTGRKGKIRVQTVSEGSTVLVTIADTGCGIPEANRNKVFDPFFTTKEVGRGTGQGLAIARSVVVDRHQGALTFDSEMGKGTTFYVRLPIHPGVAGRDERTP